MLCGSFERVANSSNSPREIILQIQRASEIWKRSLLLPENSKPALADHPQTRHTAGLAINDDPFALREIIEYRIRCSLSETVERSKLLLPNWINLKRNSPKSPRSPINGLDFTMADSIHGALLGPLKLGIFHVSLMDSEAYVDTFNNLKLRRLIIL